VENADGRLEVFQVGEDSALWHNWQTTPGGGWNGWNSLGGEIYSFTVGRNADGRLEVFAMDLDFHYANIWQTTPGGSWSNWSLTGESYTWSVVGRNTDGRLEVFAVGADDVGSHGALWHNWQTTPGGGWSGWNSLGGSIYWPLVEANSDGRLEVFARGPNEELLHIWQNGPAGTGWSDWYSLE
jgi:hypothetical protein